MCAREVVDEQQHGGTAKEGGRWWRWRRGGMCPKRRMHAETRKRYIRGLAAGDGRPGGHLSSTYTCDIHMRKRDTLYREIHWQISGDVPLTAAAAVAAAASVLLP